MEQWDRNRRDYFLIYGPDPILQGFMERMRERDIGRETTAYMDKLWLQEIGIKA